MDTFNITFDSILIFLNIFLKFHIIEIKKMLNYSFNSYNFMILTFLIHNFFNSFNFYSLKIFF